VRRDPSNSKAWEHLGNLYFDAGEPAKAVNAYNKALVLNPDNADVLVDCGVMYRELKEFDKALEYFNKALTLDPGHEHALFNSGVVRYFDLQKNDEAHAKRREELRINPEARMPSKERLSDMVESLSEK
jgi:tetratricopeptide (TPR) repeat protein